MKPILVLKVVNTHGLRGDVRALYYADAPNFFDSVEYVSNAQGERFDIENVREQKGALLIHFKGIESIESAERLRGMELYLNREQLSDLPDGQYYISDLLGFSVVTESGEAIGKLTDVLSAGSGSVLEIKRENGKKVLIPFVDEFVPEIDMTAEKIVVTPIQGMIENEI